MEDNKNKNSILLQTSTLVVKAIAFRDVFSLTVRVGLNKIIIEDNNQLVVQSIERKHSDPLANI